MDGLRRDPADAFAPPRRNRHATSRTRTVECYCAADSRPGFGTGAFRAGAPARARGKGVDACRVMRADLGPRHVQEPASPLPPALNRPSAKGAGRDAIGPPLRAISGMNEQGGAEVVDLLAPEPEPASRVSRTGRLGSLSLDRQKPPPVSMAKCTSATRAVRRRKKTSARPSRPSRCARRSDKKDVPPGSPARLTAPEDFIQAVHENHSELD